MHGVLAKCYNHRIKLKYMAVASVLAVCLAAGAETVDPAQFGLSPDAESGVNVAAMRRALTGGGSTSSI